MSELDEILASASTPPAQPQPMKSAKEMLGDRLRTQMGSAGEKRKLEDPTNGSELMSKTQKMDSDLDAVANSLDLNKAEGNEAAAQQLQNGGGQQKLLAKALMEKRPPPAGAGPPGVGPGPGPGGPMGQPPMMGGMKPGQPSDRVLLQKLGDLHKENRRDEIQALLSEHPQLMQKMKMHQQQQQAQQAAAAAGMNRMNNNMMVNDNMAAMNNDNFYNNGGPPMGGPMGGMPQQRGMPMRPPMGGQWNGGQNNMCQNPAMYNQHKMPSMRPQGPQRGFFNEGGPPPNAWVQPNDPNGKMGIMSNGGPNGPPAYYNRNNMNNRPPMMRPNNYDNFPNGGNQMYHGGPGGGGNMRGNYNPNMDPYGNARFGSPNNVSNQPMFSPNNGGNDSMHALRMSANFPNDSNAGYNGYNNEFGPGPGGPNPNYNRTMRPNFVNPNMGPNGPQNGPMYNRVNMPQTSPAMNDINMGFQPQQPQNFGMNGNFDNHQSFPPQQPQQQQPHANGGLNTTGDQQQQQQPQFNDLGGLNEVIENDWKTRAGDVRQTLLSKLKEALVSQNYPNAIEMAENYEERSFINANSLQDYQYKLVEWLACIYDSSTKLENLNSPIMGNPDSSTNGLAEVTTSNVTSPKTESTTDIGLMEAVSKDDLLATPKSEKECLSPSLTQSPGSSSASVASPMSTSATSITTVSNNTCTTSSTSSTAASAASTASTTFQCPVPPSQQSDSDKSLSATSTPSTRPSPPGTTVTSSQQPQQPPQPQQRRISGSGNMQSIPISSIGNNPQSVDSGIGLGSPRSITSGSSSTLYSPKIQGTSPSLLNSDNSPEKATNSS